MIIDHMIVLQIYEWKIIIENKYKRFSKKYI